MILLTGRRLDDLLAVCPHTQLFDLIVADNGTVVYDPISREETPGQRVRIQRVVNTATGEVELHRHSQAREQKEQAIQDRVSKRFESVLKSLSDGLSEKRYHQTL